MSELLIFCFIKCTNEDTSDTNEEKAMCTKLDELSKLTVEKLYEQYSDLFRAAPINIEMLLHRLEVPFIEQDFSEIDGQVGNIKLPEQADEVLGAVSAIADKTDPHKDFVKIYVNKFDTYNRKRFTLAHELGHCMNDAENLKNGFIELRSTSNGSSPKEIEINKVAAEILMPETLLKAEYNKLYIPVLQILSNKFKVSDNVMQVRLSDLNMEYVSI